MTALISHLDNPANVTPTATAVLHIVQGVHQGVALSLDRDHYTIGRAGTTDLVLHDDGVADRHVRLRLDNQRVSVEALDGDVNVRHADGASLNLPKGHGHLARLPVVVQVGQARLSIRATASHSATPRWRTPQSAIGVVLLLVCGAVWAFHQPAVEDFSVTLPPPAAAAKQAPSLATAKGWLAGQIQQAGLSGIRVEEDGQRLSASGSYPPARKGAWEQLQRDFDSRFGQDLVLEGQVSQAVPVQAPRVRFQAVWFGKGPYVIDGSGRQLFPGAALEDRWVLQAIEDGKVVLTRGDERYTFTL